MHFHPSYQTMSWNSPQLDLNTTSEAMTQQKSAGGAILPISPHSLLKLSRQRTLSEQLLCITHYSREAFLRAQPGKFVKLPPAQVKDMKKIKDHQIDQSKFEWKRERKSHNKKVSFSNITLCDQNGSEALKSDTKPKRGHNLRLCFLDLDFSVAEVTL